MQMARFLYISRKWSADEALMGSALEHLAAVTTASHDSSGSFQLLLFPEGTNLTADTRRKSDVFAEKNNLSKYRHVLHPRTTGFSFLAEKMRQGELCRCYYYRGLI